MPSDQSARAVPRCTADHGRLAQSIIAAIHRAIPEGVVGKRIPLHEPCFAGREWAYVKECLDTGWVSSAGSFVDRFERMLADRVGSAAAIATVNGTAALHAALLVAGVASGDEVIAPTLTFVATANAIAYCGAIPHFVDCSRSTLGIDPERLERYLARIAQRQNREWINRETGRTIRAVLPVHAYGHPVDIDPIVDLCEYYNFILIEDAAEAIGSLYKGRAVGCCGHLATFSFNGNKTITTGGGGAIVTDDPKLAAAARHITTTARLEHPWRHDHDQIGYNYRLPSMNAALGCAQLEQLDALIACKRTLACRYEAAFTNVAGVKFFKEPAFATSNYWLNVILLESGLRRRARCRVEGDE